MAFYSAHRCSDISVHTSPPRAVSCCLKVSSSCSLTSSCWLFLSRSVSRERILCNQHHMPRRNYKASKAQSDRFWRQPKKIFNTTDRTGPPFYLQQLAFVGAGRPDVPSGHVIDLSPEVSVLLFESLQLCLGLGDRVAGFEAQPGDEVLFSTFGGHGRFTGATQKKDLHKEKETSPGEPRWHSRVHR